MFKQIAAYRRFPFWVFHLPVFPYYLLLGLRSRSLSFVTNVNPGLFMGGFVNASKVDTLRLLDQSLVPAWVYFSGPVPMAEVRQKMTEHNISFPVILKPDRKERGKGVVLVKTAAELEAHLRAVQGSFLVQEFADYPLEFGVLYYRLPSSGEAGISSVCLKHMPSVTGNGRASVDSLIKEKYGRRSFPVSKDIDLKRILQPGESVTLDYVAHRSRRSIFLDAGYLNSPELKATFDRIASQIPGFYFGRFDVKAGSFDDLIHGRNLKILEVNGSNSQPIHIFDPRYGIGKTYSELFSHWRLISRISAQNRLLGFHPVPVRSLWYQILKNLRNEE